MKCLKAWSNEYGAEVWQRLRWSNSRSQISLLGFTTTVRAMRSICSCIPTSGMTHKKQAEAIEAFKNGGCKVLICTPDAAGEGIDIPNCNLVITIECISDEIKLVQLKGR